MTDRGHIWLLQSLRGLPEEHLWKLLLFAYVLRPRKNGFEISRRLLATRVVRFRTWTFALENSILMPDDILDYLDEKREEVGKSLQRVVMTPVFKFGQYECRKSKDFVFDYLQSLNDVGILPGSPRFEKKNYHQSLSAANNIARHVYANHDGCACAKHSGYKQRAELVTQLEKCFEKMGLCLECVEGVLYEGHPAHE
ncbi:hypothetical protein BJY01DRAFT_250024 [Aspergillus pseudoustus]|uniref:Uncharacterized protein n=1 Tax=Aspergillus pseudoustus TaxID=1810923 RepID=A0ABR4JN49_9EURO